MTTPSDWVLVPRDAIERLALVSEPEAARVIWKALRASEPTRIRQPQDVYARCGPRMSRLEHEEFCVLVLDAQSGVLGEVTITTGLLNASLIAPREVFRAVLKYPAAGVILVHNHPSGEPTPSADDRAATRQLVEAGRLLDLPVYDHVVIGKNRYVSFAEAGLL
jgi:DNA repair protein RadC